MKPLLDQIGALPGVLGVIVAESGKVTMSSLPAIFSSDRLEEGLAPLIQAYDTADALSVAVSEVVFSFGDTSVLAWGLTPARLLLVMCRSETDIRAISDFLRQAKSGGANRSRDGRSRAAYSLPDRSSVARMERQVVAALSEKGIAEGEEANGGVGGQDSISALFNWSEDDVPAR